MGPSVFPVFAFDCAFASKKDKLTFDRLVIRNQSSSNLLEVSLRVLTKGTVIECGTVWKGREFSLGFPEIEDDNVAAFLFFEQNGTPFKMALVSRFDLHEKGATGGALIVIAEVYDLGHLELRLE